MPWSISVNNLWIADLGIFREWIDNNQWVTTSDAVISWNKKVVILGILPIQSLFIGKL